MHPEFASVGSFAHLKLGRNAPKLDDRTLQLARYVDTKALPAPLAVFDLSGKVKAWGMDANDQYGDCTCAAVAHMITAWTSNASIEHDPTASEALALYWATGDPPNVSNPGGPTDNGRNELDVLNYWRKTGIKTAGKHNKITAFASVNVHDLNAVREAVYLFGGLYIGIALPLSAQRQAEWDVVGDGRSGDSAPGSWGGHAVDVVGYDASTFTVVTWGATLKMTYSFWFAYVEESYAVLSHDWLTPSKETPAGFNLRALESDLHAITA